LDRSDPWPDTLATFFRGGAAIAPTRVESLIMIPRAVHYCWFGDRPMPESHRAYVDGWRTLLPDWEFVFWNEHNSPMHVPYLERARSGGRWVNLANFIRLYAVYHRGGVYLDTDVEIVKPLDPLLAASRCFFGYQIPAGERGENDVNNAVFGAEQGHPFVGRQLEAIQALYDGLETEYLSGPHLTTFMLRSNGLLENDGHDRGHDVMVYPREFFFPYSWLEVFDASCVTDRTYAIHHWAGLWGEDDALQPASAASRALPLPGWLRRLARRILR
jgi:mannosyltransferase OCH1-like enzyme